MPLRILVGPAPATSSEESTVGTIAAVSTGGTSADGTSRTTTMTPWSSIGVPRLPRRFTVRLRSTRSVLIFGVGSRWTTANSSRISTNNSMTLTGATSPVASLTRYSLRSVPSAVVRCVKSSPRFRANRTSSSAPTLIRSSSCRAGQEPARPLSHCTVPPISCSNIAVASHATGCSLSARTGRSSTTSATCCRHSASAAFVNRQSTISVSRVSRSPWSTTSSQHVGRVPPTGWAT